MVKKTEKTINLIKYLSSNLDLLALDLESFLAEFLDLLLESFEFTGAYLVSNNSEDFFYPKSNITDLSQDPRAQTFNIASWGQLYIIGEISNPESIEEIAATLSLFFANIELNRRMSVTNELSAVLRKVFKPELAMEKIYTALKDYAQITDIYFFKKIISLEDDDLNKGYSLLFHQGTHEIDLDKSKILNLTELQKHDYITNRNEHIDTFISKVRGREWGQMIVVRKQPWTAESREILEICAEQLATIFNQHELHSESLTTAQREFLLNQITTKIRESLVVDKIINTAVLEVAQVMGAESCGILVLNRKIKGSLGHATWSIEEKYNSSMTQSLYAVLGTELQPSLVNPSICISNTKSSDEYKELFPRDLEIKSYLSCGLFEDSSKELVGIIAVSFFEQQRSWSYDEKLLLEGVAKQLEIALMQASIYQESQQTKRQMALLHKLSSDIRDSLDVSIVLGQIARGIGEVLGLSRCFVRRFNFNDKNQVILKTEEEYCSTGFQPTSDLIFGFEKEWITDLASQGENLDSFAMLNIPSIKEKFSENNPGLFKIADLIQLKSYLSIPLIARGKILGTINVHQCDRERIFLVEEIEFIFRVGSEAAIALEHAALFDTINKLNKTDPDTGLYNKKHFKELATEEIARCKEEGKNVSFMMIDIDYLKDINDDREHGGHDAGDEAIQILAQVLAKTVRQTPVDEVQKRVSDLVGRFGGDEFMIFLPNTHIDDAVKVAQRIANNLKRCKHSTWPKDLTCSIGVSGTPNDAHDYDIMKSQADKALYISKLQGRNRISSSLQIS